MERGTILNAWGSTHKMSFQDKPNLKIDVESVNDIYAIDFYDKSNCKIK
ncbi:MAG TPA: hypothetical protein VK588_12865 [Chitinophagaceae bacterium]|nr:hypothetical protein [Chitinophagaceae bacterium]